MHIFDDIKVRMRMGMRAQAAYLCKNTRMPAKIEKLFQFDAPIKE